MLQPASRVLPSNAPPLRDGSDSLHQASRVLQEHSGNRQLNDFGLGNGYDTQKYQIPYQSENAYQAPLQAYQPQVDLLGQQARTRYGQTYYPHSRPAYGYCHGEDDRVVVQRAHKLYSRFKASNLYLKYRGRQHKDDKGGQDQKWPDHLEQAFFRALVKYPPMGRRKALHKDKQRGRNELIADHIQELTGEARTRKQVSSHIQVLKPFVEDDPHIMRYLSKEDMGAMNSNRHYSASHGAGYGRRMSTYPAPGLPYATRGATTTQPQMDLETVRKSKHRLDMFEPINFSMFVQRKIELSNGQMQEERLHTYTQLIECGLADKQYQDWPTLSLDYPLLDNMHKQKTLDCNVIVAEASLGFPTESFKELSGVELGIRFECSSRHLVPNAKVHYRNTFYKKGQRLHAEEIEAQFQLGEDQQSVTTSLKFGSSFWAKTLHALYGRLLKEPTEAGQDANEEVSAYINSITAVLEVIVLGPDKQHERILVMCWNFRKSTQLTGRASWRRLALPQQAATQSQYPELTANERVDSVYDYGAQYVDIPTSTQAQAQPALQSPFEYDSSSGSALSSATWPTTISDVSATAQAVGSAEFSADNSFDFNAGAINLAYDPNLGDMDFSTFDATFDDTVDFGNTADFAQDPALEQYSAQWMDNFANSFDAQAPLSAVSADTTFAPPAQMDGSVQAYTEYPGQFNDQVYTTTPHEQQAYGGAGQDGLKDDPLGALADASYMRSLYPKPEQL